jgi:hypothetical protein
MMQFCWYREKLAKFHLRDALRVLPTVHDVQVSAKSQTAPSSIETVVILTLLPLLRTVDYAVYYDMIVNACQKYHPDGLASGIHTLCSVVSKFVSTWFCTSSGASIRGCHHEVIIASRLADVCIVSHPLMPIYLAVAILSVRRKNRQQRQLDHCTIENNLENDEIFDWNKKDDLALQFSNLFQFSSIVPNDSNINSISPSLLFDAIEEVIATALSYL